MTLSSPVGKLQILPSMDCPSPSSRTTTERFAVMEARISDLETTLSELNSAIMPVGEVAAIRSAAELLENAVLRDHAAAVSAVLPGEYHSTLFHLLKRLKKHGSEGARALADKIERAASDSGLDSAAIRALLTLRQVVSPAVHVRHDYSTAADVKAAMARAFGVGTPLTTALQSGVDLWFPAYARVRDAATAGP